MTKRFRLFIIVLLLAVSGWFLYPTVSWYFFTPSNFKELASASREQIRDYAQKQAQTRLGELKALKEKDEKAALPADLEFILPLAKHNYDTAKMAQPASWTVLDVFKAYSNENDFLFGLEEHYRKQVSDLKDSKGKILQLGLDLSGGMAVEIRADLDALEKKLGHPLTQSDRDDAMGRAMEVLRSRIDVVGVSEPVMKRVAGTDKINIELPGDVDPERVNTFLRGKGSLSLNIVDDEATAKVNQWLQANPSAIDDKGAVTSIPADVMGAGLELRSYYKKDRFGIDQFQTRIVVKTEDKFVLDGVHINAAAVERDPVSNQPLVTFSLDAEGADHFLKMTQENLRKSMAVVLDDKVRAHAVISSVIPGGRVQVSGFDQKDANDLKTTLKTGAMPVNLIVLSYTNIGATLGQDAINSGINSILWGLILVAGFMFIYYKGTGINANIALIINMFFVVAVLGVFNMTLTLTGIAGLVLTVGLTVDANVIVFERIKEEYWSGKSPATAIDIGFKRAFWTIMDSHVTALIASLFLSLLSKGAVQGFAVTLAVGLVSSLFTSLFVSRLIFDFETDVLKARRISIAWRKVQHAR
jgi:preprotein translocase subunit SecD